MQLIKVRCPYCEKEFYDLNPSHLKTHGKTISICRIEHPEIPNQCYSKPFRSVNKPFNLNEANIHGYFQDKHTDIIRGIAHLSNKYKSCRPKFPIFASHTK